MRRYVLIGLAVVLALGVVAGPAVAKKPAAKKTRPVATKMTFKIDDHTVEPGGSVTGSVLLQSRSKNKWVPLAGATLDVRVDGESIGTIVTGEDGRATVEAPAGDEGDHTIKVVYAGDASYKKAQRAQGFETMASEPAPEPAG